jgi:peptidoglycan hydrolase-like protein with peptidoglycan-binding domain
VDAARRLDRNSFASPRRPSVAKSITASVGRMGGVNRPDDVRTVQQLLNQVPLTAGGPKPPLDPDGKCGPKTIAAIQAFQLHHFGWPGADGRVDPNGRTHTKLNEFDVPGPTTATKAATLSIRRVGPTGQFVDPNRKDEWFYEVRDPAQPGISAVYYFGDRDEHKTMLTPIVFQGGSQIFQTRRAFDELDTNVASHLTDYGFPPDGPTPKFARSRFTLFYLADSGGLDNVQIAAVDHLLPPPSSSLPGLDNLASSNVRGKRGAFQFVR